MRRGFAVSIAVTILLLLAGIAVTAVGHSPASQVATSRTVLAKSITPSPSPTAAPTPQPTEVVQRKAAAVAAAAAPVTPVIARISIPRIGIRNAPIYDRGLDAKGLMLIAPGYSVTRYAYSASFGTGNTFLYGHDDIEGNIFGHLYDLRPGDTVQINVGGETQVYRVTGHQIVPPTAV